MYKDKRVLAVVPARGGSKGLPGKNLRKLGGVPLVGLAGDAARAVPLLDRAVVSTDDGEIARVAEGHGLEEPFRRPAALSGDRIADVDVLVHALQATEVDDGTSYGVVVMLQPTSPLRTTAHVISAVEKLVDEGLDAVWTVSLTDSKSHPLKQLLVTDGRLTYYDPSGAAIIARQQLAPVYHRNGFVYALTRECLLGHGALLGPRTGALVCEGPAISIDTEWDLELAGSLRRGRA